MDIKTKFNLGDKVFPVASIRLGDEETPSFRAITQKNPESEELEGLPYTIGGITAMVAIGDDGKILFREVYVLKELAWEKDGPVYIPVENLCLTLDEGVKLAQEMTLKMDEAKAASSEQLISAPVEDSARAPKVKA